ncbi:hypothetical protein MNB_SV-6-1648 [hydrothermal vent metagenome]|uniref:Periplasmic protein n=1 Tax=hydrothermal vent metagenome TaxID=652676 RepID=A0A1W1BRE5_9ZZZZ
MRLYKKILFVAGATILLGNSALVAADTSARSILKRAFHYIGNMDKYSFHAVVIDEVPTDGSIVKHRNDIFVKVDRPDKLRFDRKFEGHSKSYYINSGLFTIIDNNLNLYTQIKTPKSLNGTLDFLFKRYDIDAPLSSLIYSDMYKRTKVKRGKNFGIRVLNGVECNYIAFKDRERELHVWVATGDKPLVQGYTIVDTSIEGHPKSYTTIFWDKKAEVKDSDFDFVAPKDAAKISINIK